MIRTASIPPAAALGKRIRTLRAQLKLTQTAFGQLLDVAQPTIARWESGRHMPDEVMIRRLASIGQLSPADLRYGELETPTANDRGIAIQGELESGWRLSWLRRPASDRVAAPAEADPRITGAIRVRDGDLAPLRPGWLLFYTRDRGIEPAACIGKLSVVQTADDGEALLGELAVGSRDQVFNLSLWGGERRHDLRLAWAAPVIEIRPR